MSILESSFSRLKRKTDFNPPFEGPNGNKLTGYEWAYKVDEKWSSREQALVLGKVSDWDAASASDETGRDLVHKFFVETPEGEKIVSAESLYYILGFTDKKQNKILPSVISATKTLAKLEMEYQILKPEVEKFRELENEVEKNPPNFYISDITYRDNKHIKTFKVNAFDIKSQMLFARDYKFTENDLLNDQEQMRTIKQALVYLAKKDKFGYTEPRYGRFPLWQYEEKIKKLKSKINRMIASN